MLKGAVDGGLHVPHTVKKFPGYKEPEERGGEYEYDAGAHLERIIGTHIVEYQEMLTEAHTSGCLTVLRTLEAGALEHLLQACKIFRVRCCSSVCAVCSC